MNTLTQIQLHETQRQLRTLLKEQKRRRALVDLHFHCKYVLGYKDLTDADKFHGEYCRHIEDEKEKFKLTLTPRGTLKSSISTIGHPTQLIVKYPNIRILIASENFKNSVKYLSEIKGHLESNKEYTDLFGDLVGKKIWSGSEIIINTRTLHRKEPTISCAGVDVTKVGMHYDWIKVDDPHSDQNTLNQDQIDKVIRWYKLLLSLLDPGGHLDINGTIWHFNDLYNYLINKEQERKEAGRKKRFVIFQRDSFKGTNEDLLNDKIKKRDLLWPERLSADFLKETYIEQGPYLFSCQYRLNPVDDENAIFKRSWIQTCTPDQVPDNLSIVSVVDPMRDEEGKDYLAIVTGGMDEHWRFYFLDVRRLKADEHETVEQIYNVHQVFRPEKIGFEAVAWQKSYMKYVQMLQIMKGRHLPIVALKTDTTISKPLRIKSMVPYWKAGLFIIPCKNGNLNNLSGGMATLVDELTRYPKTANDDTIDAAAYINQLTHRPGVIYVLKKLPPGSFMAIRARLKNKKRKKLGAQNVRTKLHA